jgi:NADH dehydrogenase FAD-containing subunit
MKCLIIGAGFAGRAAAHRLNSIAGGHEVVLVDRHAYTSMIPALPDYAGGTFSASLITRDIRKTIPPRIRFVQEEIATIDLDSRRVAGYKETYTYDRLILACGSRAAFHGFEPQHSEDVYTLDSVPAAARIRREFPAYLEKRGSRAHAVVVGGGYTGMELACSLKRMARARGYDCPVTVVELMDTVLPFCSPLQREYVQRHFERLGIRLLTGSSVSSFQEGELRINNTRSIETPFLCWTAGLEFPVSDLRAAQIQRLKDGRIKVNRDLRVVNYPDVFAAGDAAAIFSKGECIRKAVNFSIYSGKKAGTNCKRSIMQVPLLAFWPLDLGWVIPLCRTSVGKLFNRFQIRGRIGLALHYLMTGIRSFAPGQRIRFFLEAIKVLVRPG